MESHRWESRCSTHFTVATSPLLYDPYELFVHLLVIFVIVYIIVIEMWEDALYVLWDYFAHQYHPYPRILICDCQNRHARHGVLYRALMYFSPASI